MNPRLVEDSDDWGSILYEQVCPITGSWTVNPRLRAFVERIANRVLSRDLSENEHELRSSQVIALAVETWYELHPTEALFT